MNLQQHTVRTSNLAFYALCHMRQ